MNRKRKSILLAKNFLSLPEIRGILDYARSKQWNLRVPRMLNLVDELTHWQGDGIITDTDCCIAEAKSRGIAIVGLTDLPSGLLHHADVIVASDDNQIGRMAAEYFLRRGYRSFACAAANVRRTAFVQRIAEEGFHTELIELSPDSYSENDRELIKSLSRCRSPFCVFCDNDFDAAIIADCAVNTGLKVPQDLAVLGVGNESFFSNPSALELSSVDSRLYERAFFAAERMDLLLDGKLRRRTSDSEPATFFRFEPKVIVERISTDFYAVEEPRLRKMVKFLQEHASSPHFRISALAEDFILTESTVYRTFRAGFGVSPKQFLLEERLRMAQRKLNDTDDTLLAIADDCGFPGPGALHYAFKRKFGCTPNEWRDAQKFKSLS